MKFNIRTINIPDDYGQISNLLNSVLSEETSAEKLKDEDSKIPPKGMLTKDDQGLLTGFDRLRIVAIDEEGRILGYGISWRAPWTAAGELNHTLIVKPEFRNHGIGIELYNRLEYWAIQNGASKLNYEVRDNEEKSIMFAKKNGYEIERHSFESVLDLASFDHALLQRVNDHYSIVHFSEIQDSNKEEKLYELYKETSFDIPGFDGDFFDLEEWKKWTIDLPGSSPEYILIAIYQDQYIGVAHLLYHVSTQSMYHEYTGVKKQFRGQGIGLSLKLKSIELALALKIRYMRTNNDSLNTSMLRINRDRLKYIAVPGKFKMIKSLK